tara:strand:- start:260 stop:649 length:390 start_codon:yes stop_codon:yes gene_type:complete
MTLQIENAILEVYPYWNRGTWVFDDDRVGLVQEPFVVGVPEMIDLMVKDIPNAREGFKMTFSKFPFPSFSQEIRKTREEGGGNWYQMAEAPYLEGWLCPALFKYFNEAPDSLYVKADKVIQDKPWWRIW